MVWSIEDWSNVGNGNVICLWEFPLKNLLNYKCTIMHKDKLCLFKENKEDGNVVIGTLLSDIEMDCKVLVQTSNGIERLGLVILINPDQNQINTEETGWTVHEAVSMDEVGGKNLYMTAEGQVVAMNPLDKGEWLVQGKMGARFATEGTLFKF